MRVVVLLLALIAALSWFGYETRARDRALSVFAWDVKARRTLEVYEWVAGQRVVRPVFEPVGDPEHPASPEALRRSA